MPERRKAGMRVKKWGWATHTELLKSSSSQIREELRFGETAFLTVMSSEEDGIAKC